MDPITLALLSLGISTGARTAGAVASSAAAKKRSDEMESAISEAEKERAQAGIDQATRAIQEAKILGPLAGQERDAVERGASLLAATNQSSGADVANLNRDIARESMLARQRGNLAIDEMALNELMEERRRLDSKIAGLSAGKTQYESDRMDALLGLLTGITSDVGLAAGTAPETFANLTPSQENALKQVLKEDPDRVRRIIEAGE